MNQDKTNSYVDRINKLLQDKTLPNHHRLTLEVGLDRLAEKLSLTPTCLRAIAYLECGAMLEELVAKHGPIKVAK